MGKIFCIMGKSSTGKDTLYKKILMDEQLGLKQLVPYTTRPIRRGEKDGVEYHFTDEAGYQKLFEEGKVIEQRTYETCYGPWRYFTVDDESILLEKFNYLVIGTLEVYRSMCEYFGDEKIVPLLVTLDDGERLARALGRERKQTNPKYEEMCRRFLADSVDFSEEKIQSCKIEKIFINDDLDVCFGEMKTLILEEMR